MDDLEFVRKCVNGDKQSWDEFVERYSRLIYRYIHSVLKIKGAANPARDSVEDLFQDIFVLLSKDNFSKLRTYKGRNGCSLASWLRQVTVNFAIDSLRRSRPAASLDEELTEDFTLKDLIADDSVSAKDILASKEKYGVLLGCIEQLDPEEKYFVELNINQGIGLEELKGLMRISRGALDMRKSRIIKRLRDCFKNKGFELDL